MIHHTPALSQLFYADRAKKAVKAAPSPRLGGVKGRLFLKSSVFRRDKTAKRFRNAREESGRYKYFLSFGNFALGFKPLIPVLTESLVNAHAYRV